MTAGRHVSCCCCIPMRAGVLVLASLSLLRAAAWIFVGAVTLDINACDSFAMYVGYGSYASNASLLTHTSDYSVYVDDVLEEVDDACREYLLPIMENLSLAVIVGASITAVAAMLYIIAAVKDIPSLMIPLIVLWVLEVAIFTVLSFGIIVLTAIFGIDAVLAVGYTFGAILLVYSIILCYFTYVLVKYRSHVKQRLRAPTVLPTAGVTVTTGALPAAGVKPYPSHQFVSYPLLGTQAPNTTYAATGGYTNAAFSGPAQR